MTSQPRDPAGNLVASPADPQSWNQYAYVLNNPTTWTDPNGLWCVTRGGDEYNSPDNGGPGPLECVHLGGIWLEPVHTTVNVRSDGSSSIVTTGGDAGPGSSSSAGWGASHPHLAPTAGMYWKAFWRNFVSYGTLPDCSVLALQLAGENLLGLSDAPPGADTVDTGLHGAAIVQANLAASYAARKALVYPFRSSVYRSMIGTSEILADLADGAGLAVLDRALASATFTASQAATEGQCH